MASSGDAFGHKTSFVCRLCRVSTGKRLFEHHAFPLYILCLFGAVAIGIAVTSGHFQYDQALFVSVVRDGGIVMAFACAARWIGFPVIADAVEQIMLLLVAGVVCAFCAVIAASTAAPLADSLLRRADMVLFGIDRVQLLSELDLSPTAIRIWGSIYNSFAVTPTLAMMLLLLTGQQWRAWALLTSMIGGAAVCILFLLVVPAYGSPPYPYDYLPVLRGARDGSVHILDGSIITGIVTFPSMHAADAVMLAVAFSWLGKWAAPLVILNILMIFSALIVGAHYAVDLVAGAALGAVSITASAWLHRRLANAAPSNRGGGLSVNV